MFTKFINNLYNYKIDYNTNNVVTYSYKKTIFFLFKSIKLHKKI